MNTLFPMFKSAYMKGTAIDLTSAGTVLKACILDLDDLGTAITGATNATPIVIEATGHGLTTGNIVLVSKVGGNTNANGVRKVTVVDADHVSLQDLSAANIAGNGAYTSGGRIWKLSGVDFLDDIASGARIGTPVEITNKTVSDDGVLDGDNVTLSSVTGDQCEAILVFIDGANDAARRAVGVIGSATSGLPVTPNGGNVGINWPPSGIFQL